MLIFTTAVALATALLCGVLPATRTARADAAGGLAAAARPGASPPVLRGMRPLVAAQLALAVVVVFSAALLGRSLVNFARVDPGYDTDHVVSVSFNPAASGYPVDQVSALGTRLVDTVASIPGFESAAVSTCGLLADCSYSSSFVLDGDRARGEIDLDENHVGPGYFSTSGIRVIAGREFDQRDRDGGALVAIVSESVARRYFPEKEPVGRQIGDGEFNAEIVGVVSDVRPYSLRDAPVAMVYFPIRQWPSPPHNLSVRVTDDVSRSAAAVRATLQRAEPGLVLDNVTTMALQVERNVLRERLVTYLAAAFGVLSLLLGCVGLYGVLSYAVARQSQEFGVRLALGASPRDLRQAVFADALRVAVAGTGAGLIVAFWAAAFLDALLFGVSTFDPLVAIVSAALLIGTTLAASYLPARRAARIDPLVVLRQE